MAPSTSATVYRRKVRGKKAKRYTIEVRLADGTRVQKVGFTDRAASLQLAAKMVRDIERREVGLHDVLEGSRRTPLAQHLEDFLLAMRQGTLGRRRHGGSCSEDWINRAKKRLLAMFTAMSATRVEHLEQIEAERFLDKSRAGGWAPKTRDDHAALLRQFGAWLVDSRRAHENPFHRLRPIRDGASKTFLRHALTVDELRQLVEAAEVRPVQEFVRVVPFASAEQRAELAEQGRERGVLYQVAAYTGLRRSEVLALQWGDLLLGDAPAIVVRAETTKNRRGVRIELPRWLGLLLDELRRVRSKSIGGLPSGKDSVFLVSYRHVTERLRLDAEFARLGTVQTIRGRKRLVSEDGRVVDFHALRGTLATLAAEMSMPAKHLQELMRHSDIRLTMEIYAQVRRPAMRAEVEKLPSPSAPPVPAPVPAETRRTLAHIVAPGETEPGARRAGS